ncbi:MAG TPA: transcription elongation factor GreA [Candidatus Saccharimonadales bacterium]|nr:transcription elongation factor GreA [Candidatus Saccharimonadales bacterium]
MKKDYQLTKAGWDELGKELAELKARRGEIAEKIKSARDFGDLSENAEYDAARDEQAQVEARIAAIEDILQNASVLKGAPKKGTVAVGSTVTLEGPKGEVEYTIVSSVEADPALKKISDESPIGQALIGKKVGQSAEIKTPSGSISFEIKHIA